MTDSSGRPRVRMTGRERREQLLDVGRSLFAEKGFEATSIEEIASRAGVSKPVVYEHFGGKEGLYAVVVDREMGDLLDRLTAALEAGHPRRLVEQAALALLTYIEEQTDGFRILSRDSPVAGSGGGTYSSLLNDIASQAEHIMAREFESRGMRTELAPMYAQMLVGMVALTGQWWLEERKPPREEVAAHLVNLGWNGLAHLDPDPRILLRGQGLMSHDVLVSAVRAYLEEQRAVIAETPASPGQRTIHRTRVTVRRYRSVLRVFADVFDERRVAALDAELVWFAAALGTVRDVHVMRTHLCAVLDDLGPDLDASGLRKRVERTLATKEKEGRRALTRVIKSRRLQSLRDELAAWSARPPLADPPVLHRDLPGYLDMASSRAATRLRRARRIGDADPGRDAALHRARKAAKRARYTAELAAPVLGKPARKAVKRWRHVQDELGEHQDGSVAADFLRTLVGDPADFTLGVVWTRERSR